MARSRRHPSFCAATEHYAIGLRLISGRLVHHVAQALEAGKLFHIDLNDQVPGRYDQDFRFASVNYKSNFFLVKLLSDYKYKGMKHFDSHAYRQSDYGDVLEFAKGSMRNWKILEHKVQQFNADKKIQKLLKDIDRKNAKLSKLTGKFTKANAKALLAADLDRVTLAAKPMPYEELDQLVGELIMGVR